MRYVTIFLPFILVIVLTLHPQTAVGQQQLRSEKEALDLIADFADRLCTKIDLEGSGSSLDLSGTAKAELSVLLKKMVNLGIQGAAKYQESQYQGLLQKDLLAAIRESTNCKLEVWKDLKDKFFVAPSPRSQDQNSQLAFTQHHLHVLSSRSAVYEKIAAEHEKFKDLKVCEGRDRMEAQRLRTTIDLLKSEFRALESELAKIEQRKEQDIEPDFLAPPCPPQSLSVE